MTEAGKVLTGIDVLAADGFAPLAGLRVGLLTNPAGRARSGQSTIDALAGAPGVTLAALFSPEHGLEGDREGDIESRRDARTGLPVHSLYGTTRRPLGSMLAGLDALVIDLQDVGVRFYTYATTMAYILEAAAKRKLKVIVLDRPNPIGAAGVRGPLPDRDVKSFTNYFRMPLQHGMTLGELGRLFNAERRIGADLTVIAMQGYVRASWYDETGLAWVAAVAQPALAGGDDALSGRRPDRGHQRQRRARHAHARSRWSARRGWTGRRSPAALQRRGIAGVRFASAALHADGKPLRRTALQRHSHRADGPHRARRVPPRHRARRRRCASCIPTASRCATCSACSPRARSLPPSRRARTRRPSSGAGSRACAPSWSCAPSTCSTDAAWRHSRKREARRRESSDELDDGVCGWIPALRFAWRE